MRPFANCASPLQARFHNGIGLSKMAAAFEFDDEANNDEQANEKDSNDGPREHLDRFFAGGVKKCIFRSSVTFDFGFFEIGLCWHDVVCVECQWFAFEDV